MCICVSFVCLLCSWDARHVFCWCRSGRVVLSFKPLRLVVSWESLSSSRSPACLCPHSHSLVSLNRALCIGESVRATCIFPDTLLIWWVEAALFEQCCFFCADLAPPKGIRFSDVTDTSTTVHWGAPRVRVDSYQITYVPAHGGQYLCVAFIPHTDHNWCFFFF